MKYCNIPIFIPELACPNRCVFCNQNKISGALCVPKREEIINHTEQYLSTLNHDDHVEIAFFGGNFTGIPIEEQKRFLNLVQPYIQNGSVRGIRISTRPDYITLEILELLKENNVKTIELGAQSFDDTVLKLSGRGHSAEDIYKAVELIHAYGFELGLQMMIGLPGDSKEKSLLTAHKIIECRASSTRIYPTLVIKDTKLAELYQQKKYAPLSLHEAVDQAKDMYLLFVENGVTVLRVGLHPSKEFDNKTSLIAGPYHPSFKELMLTSIWKDIFKQKLPEKKGKLKISTADDQINYAVGHKSSNKSWLKDTYGWVRIIPDNSLKNFEFHACYC